MKEIINRLTSNRNLAGAVLACAAWLSFQVTRATGSIFYLSLMTIFACVAAGLFLKMSWARRAGIGLLCWLFLVKMTDMVTKGFTWNRLIQTAALGFAAYGLWRKPEDGLMDDLQEDGDSGQNPPETPGETSEDTPLVSLVHLREEPRYLEASILALALSDAWGLKLVTGDREEGDGNEADGIVGGENPVYIVAIQKPVPVVFSVHNHDGMYFDEAEKLAARITNLRFREVVLEHRAWLAVDLLGASHTLMPEEDVYRMLGKAVVALADDKVLAIFCPQHHAFNLWSPELEEMLVGDEPLEALKTEVKAPVIDVPTGPSISAAVSEARRRWPEFVEAFHHRQPGDERFIVKAPFTGENGGVEHMWIQVFGLEPAYVHGHLLSEPIHCTRLKPGAQVEVPVSEISDWICPDNDGNPHGNFTSEAVGRAARGG